MLGTPKYSLITKLILLKWSIKDKLQEILRMEPPIKVMLEVTVKDRNGKIIKRHKQHSHSFVSNYLAIVGTLMAMSFNGSFQGYWWQDTAGDWQTFEQGTVYLYSVMTVNDTNGDSSYGIVVGTGTTSPSATDYKLQSPISNGTGTGQLQYGSHSFTPGPVTGGYGATSKPSSGVVTVNGNTTSFQISRTFLNNSGSSITVSEVGIIASLAAYNGTGFQQDYALIVHDLLSSPVSIPNGSSLAITYTFQTTT